MSGGPRSRREIGVRERAWLEEESARIRDLFALPEDGAKLLDQLAKVERARDELLERFSPGSIERQRIREVASGRISQLKDELDVEKTTRAARKRRANAFQVKGRYDARGRLVWDVFQLDGYSTPRVVYAGLGTEEEALVKAGELLLGRVSVYFGGAGAAFRRAGRGLLLPERAVDPRVDARVRLHRKGDGSVVFSCPRGGQLSPNAVK